MIHATEVLGAEVYDALGNFAGRVREMFIEPADQPNRIARLLLSRGRYGSLVVRHDQVESVLPGTIRLNVAERALEAFAPNEAWLAVRKDLLDQQIIDTSGRKVVRVNDIDLHDVRINGSIELRVFQVDIGLTGAARRLLQGLAPPSVIRRLQEKLPPKLIRWEFVNLIEPDPMRRVKLRITSRNLETMHPADLADILEDLAPAERQAIIDTVDEGTAAEALAELDRRLQAQIVEKLDPEKAADIIEEMAPDEAADLIADLPPETKQEVLDELPREEAQEVRALLRFEPHTAGGLMNTEIIYVGQDATRDEVVEWIRQQDVNLEQLDTVFLIDRGAAFAGCVSLGRLLLAAPGEPMSAFRQEPLLSVRPDTDGTEVFELFDKYNLRSLAVVDEEGHPLGAITVDDVVSGLRQGP
jgi:CBS domain-containing protein/sporulation protein YlmC with PRC-barrel domain